MPNKTKVLVFFSFRSHKRGYIEMLFERLHRAAKSTSLTLQRGSLKDLHIQIAANKLRVTESLQDNDLRNYDLLYFELWAKAPQQALAAALYARRHNLAFFSDEVLAIQPSTKIGELAKLADNNIPLPDTFISSHREITKKFAAKPPINFPLVIKAANGYGGKNNFLVDTYEALCDILQTHKDLQFVVQEFIPNSGDYRCLVMGGEIMLVLHRIRKSNSTHLNNTSQGAEAQVVPLHDLSPTIQALVLRAAAAVGRSDFAGVDLMLDANTGTPYILEVNEAPQIEIGAAVDAKLAALLKYMQARAV